MNTTFKNVKLVESNTKIATVFLNTQKNYKKCFMKTRKNDVLIHKSILTMISISSFYCCEKLFTLMKIWMIGKNKWSSLVEKEHFYSHLKMEDITDAD